MTAQPVYKTDVNSITLQVATRAIADEIIPVHITLPKRNSGKTIAVKEVRNSEDMDVAVVILRNGHSLPANELLGEEMIFECGAETYAKLADLTAKIDYRTVLDQEMVKLEPSIFNYSLTCQLNDDVIDIGPFKAYVVCDNCEEVHTLDEDDFAKLHMTEYQWGQPKTPFSSGRNYVSLHVSAETYRRLLQAAKTQAELSICPDATPFDSVCPGDVVYGPFGIGRVIDVIESYDVKEDGVRYSRPGGKVVVAAYGSVRTTSAAAIRRGWPEEFNAC
jgi:hypothetical protein